MPRSPTSAINLQREYIITTIACINIYGIGLGGGGSV